MPTKRQAIWIVAIAAGVIIAVNYAKRTPLPGYVAKVPLVGAPLAVGLFG